MLGAMYALNMLFGPVLLHATGNVQYQTQWRRGNHKTEGFRAMRTFRNQSNSFSNFLVFTDVNSCRKVSFLRKLILKSVQCVLLLACRSCSRRCHLPSSDSSQFAITNLIPDSFTCQISVRGSAKMAFCQLFPTSDDHSMCVFVKHQFC